MRFRLPFIHEVPEEHTREDFKKVQSYLADQDLLKGDFKFFEKDFSFSAYPQTIFFRHGLGFHPTDVLQTSVISTGTVTWNYSSFTPEFLSITLTASAKIRFFAGRYREE